MSDAMVKAAQNFINRTYGHVDGIPTLEEDGKTGWPVMYALTRALQYEYGTGGDAEKYGRELIGLYNILENYNKLSRAQ